MISTKYLVIMCAAFYGVGDSFLYSMIATKLELHEAARQNRLTDVKYHLAVGDSIDSVDYKGYTALHWAARNGHADVVKFLLSFDANFSLRSNKGKTPLEVAKKNGHTEVVEILENYKAESCSSSPVHTKPKKGPSVQRSSELNKTDFLGKTPLYRALEEGDYDKAIALLEQGADPNVFDKTRETPLHLAVRDGDKNLDLVMKLLANGADPSGRDYLGYTPLHKVAELGDKAYDIAQALVKKGARCTQPTNDDADDTPFKIIWEKIKDGKFPRYRRMFRLFLLYGVNVNEKSSHWSDAESYVRTSIKIPHFGYELALIMIACGANPSVFDPESLGRMLFYSVEEPDQSGPLTKKLLASGAKHYLTSEDGWTPLLKAASLGEHALEALVALLEYNADVTKTTGREGKTALHYAVHNGCLRAVTLLCHKGADMLKPDAAGITPLECSRQPGLESIREFLETFLNDQRAAKKSVKQKQINDMPVDDDLQDELFKAASNPKSGGTYVKTLLSKHADPLKTNAKGQSAFLLGVLSATEPFEFLKACLDYMRAFKEPEVVQKALNEGLCAIAFDDKCVSTAEFLISQGAQVDWENVVGESPLYTAVITKAKQLMKIFILQGADPYKTVSLTKKSSYDSADFLTKMYIKKILKEKKA